MSFAIESGQNCIGETVGPAFAKKFVIPPESKHELLLRLREMNLSQT